MEGGRQIRKLVASGPTCVQCVGVLAKSLGWRWQVHAERLIKPMKLTGLSDNLVQAYKVNPTPPTILHPL